MLPINKGVFANSVIKICGVGNNSYRNCQISEI